MARKQKGVTEVTPTQKTSEATRLIEEAMGELERLTARCFELEKIASQLGFGPAEDLQSLLWEARTLRLMADPDKNESVHTAIQRRLALSPDEAKLFRDRAAMRAEGLVEKTIPIHTATSVSLLAEASAEIERLTKELSAKVAGDGQSSVMEELREILGAKDGEATIEAANRLVEDKLVTPEEWRQICGFCGHDIDDAVGVIVILQWVREKLGEEVEDKTLDDAVSARLSDYEEFEVKAKVFDNLVKSELGTVVSDALHAALERHDSPMRAVWERLSSFDRKRIVHEAQEHAEGALAALGEGLES